MQQLWWPVTICCGVQRTCHHWQHVCTPLQHAAEARGESVALEKRMRHTTSQRKAALSCRTLLAREQGRIRAEYEERVRQLEQERQGVEEERVQVEPQAMLASCWPQF